MLRYFLYIPATLYCMWINRHRYDYERRNSKKYKKKQQIVKNIWIGMGTVMILLNTFVVTMVLLLLTTFYSFVVLDETE